MTEIRTNVTLYQYVNLNNYNIHITYIQSP